MLTEHIMPHSLLAGDGQVLAKTQDLHKLAEAARRRCAAQLKTRMQDVLIDPRTCRASARLDARSMIGLLTRCVHEISGLALRHTTIVVCISSQEIVIRGKNPLDLPDGDLALDHQLLFKAQQLGLVPRLSWDQGVGPVLTLTLPGLIRFESVEISHRHTGPWIAETAHWSARVLYQKVS